MKILILIFSKIALLSCFLVYKCNSYDSMEQTRIDRQVSAFANIPEELLSYLDSMGMDNSSKLTDYEAKYLTFIFKIDTNEFNLVEKNIGFLGSKRDFFSDERQWYYRGEKSGVGGCCIYILNTTQKKESGGYDAAIMYWKKFVIPVDKVVKRLKEKSLKRFY